MHDAQPQGGDAAPGVDQLRQEVQSLRQDVDTIRSAMQEMHREVRKTTFICSLRVEMVVAAKRNTDAVAGPVSSAFRTRRRL